MRLFRRGRDIPAFDALASQRLGDAVFPLPLCALGRAYYDATLPDAREEVSFLIEHEGRAVVAVVADLGGGRLGRYGMPAELLIDRACPPAALERALNEAMGEIGRLLKAASATGADILTLAPGGEADYAIGQLVAAGFEPAPHLRAVATLAGEASFESRLRKGHRQAVRWGKEDRKSTRLNSSHVALSRMPSSA